MVEYKDKTTFLVYCMAISLCLFGVGVGHLCPAGSSDPLPPQTQ